MACSASAHMPRQRLCARLCAKGGTAPVSTTYISTPRLHMSPVIKGALCHCSTRLQHVLPDTVSSRSRLSFRTYLEHGGQLCKTYSIFTLVSRCRDIYHVRTLVRQDANLQRCR